MPPGRRTPLLVDVYLNIAGRPTNQTQLNNIHQTQLNNMYPNSPKQQTSNPTKQHTSKLSQTTHIRTQLNSTLQSSTEPEDISVQIAGRPTNQTQLNDIHQNSTQQHTP